MKNKQIEIILSSIDENDVHGYVVETFYQPIKQIKDTIARGLKGINTPIADEDLAALKSSFMRFEMAIDKNLQQELGLLPTLLNEQGLSKQETEKVNKALEKEKNLALTIHNILDQSIASCQVYDLLKQALYKSDDRVDVLEHFMDKH
jgi:hypothetical protein